LHLRCLPNVLFLTLVSLVQPTYHKYLVSNPPIKGNKDLVLLVQNLHTYKMKNIHFSFYIKRAKFTDVCRNVKEFTDQEYRVYLKYLEKFVSELFTKEQRKSSIKSCPQMSGFDFH